MSGKVKLSSVKQLREAQKPVTAIKVTREEAESSPVDKAKKYHFKEGRMYTHPPLKLVNGSVDYTCKLLGAVEVSETTGSHIIKDAVDKLKVKGSGVSQMPEVTLSISIRGITIKDMKTKRNLHQHPIHHISFCAEDKRASPCVIAYIARSKTEAKVHTCFLFYATNDGQSEDISTTIGEAFELAYQHYQEAKEAQKDFAELKASLQTTEEKEQFAMQLQKLQGEVQRMELESRTKPKPPLEKFPNTVAQWERITSTLEPLALEPSMDPGLMHLVPRPQTQDLDSAIAYIEQQLTELDEGFAQLLTVNKLTKSNGGQRNLQQQVMSDVEDQIKELQAQNEALDEPDLPVNYQMEEYTRAKATAVLPKAGSVKQAATQWPPADSEK